MRVDSGLVTLPDDGPEQRWRRTVRKRPAKLKLGRLLRDFGYAELDDDVAEAIESRMASVGLAVRPSLRDAAADEIVTVYRPQGATDDPAPPAAAALRPREPAKPAKPATPERPKAKPHRAADADSARMITDLKGQLADARAESERLRTELDGRITALGDAERVSRERLSEQTAVVADQARRLAELSGLLDETRAALAEARDEIRRAVGDLPAGLVDLPVADGALMEEEGWLTDADEPLHRSPIEAAAAAITGPIDEADATDAPPPDDAPAAELTAAPVDDAPAAELAAAPVDDAPASELAAAPVEDAPASELAAAPVDDAPASELAAAPVEDAPASELAAAPVEDAPASELAAAPVEDAPASELAAAPVEDAPAGDLAEPPTGDVFAASAPPPGESAAGELRPEAAATDAPSEQDDFGFEPAVPWAAEGRPAVAADPSFEDEDLALEARAPVPAPDDVFGPPADAEEDVFSLEREVLPQDDVFSPPSGAPSQDEGPAFQAEAEPAPEGVVEPVPRRRSGFFTLDPPSAPPPGGLPGAEAGTPSPEGVAADLPEPPAPDPGDGPPGEIPQAAGDDEWRLDDDDAASPPVEPPVDEGGLDLPDRPAAAPPPAEPTVDDDGLDLSDRPAAVLPVEPTVDDDGLDLSDRPAAVLPADPDGSFDMPAAGRSGDRAPAPDPTLRPEDAPSALPPPPPLPPSPFGDEPPAAAGPDPGERPSRAPAWRGRMARGRGRWHGSCSVCDRIPEVTRRRELEAAGWQLDGDFPTCPQCRGLG